MVAHELIVDPVSARTVHTTPTCSALDLGTSNEPGAARHEAQRRGLIIPTWQGRGRRACPTCTLVADPVWAIAA
jgi:hypothetical protein